ncbi:MAG: hypothetical protein P8M03_07580 [Flavobacteriaceae bacterium]|nr:hypothetical protein [Flavobacteriaceae bacterium]
MATGYKTAGSGRKLGTPNKPDKITSEIRKIAKATLEQDLVWYVQNRDTFKPETRLVAMFKLCSYVLPKVVAVSQTDGEPFRF